jgi:DNA-binding IclR family transcriptional regulator
VRAALDRLADELAAHEEFLAVELDLDREYAVNVVNAPVFDHTGHVTLVLSLTGFDRALRGREVVAAGDALVTATARITDALTPSPTSRSRTSRS